MIPFHAKNMHTLIAGKVVLPSRKERLYLTGPRAPKRPRGQTASLKLVDLLLAGAAMRSASRTILPHREASAPRVKNLQMS